MQGKIDNRKDILLLLLWAPGRTGEPNEPISGRTRLVKLLFLFKMEALSHFAKGTSVNADNFYEFFPWNFGPFSTQVYDDLTFFQLRGFLSVLDSNEEPLVESREEWERYIADTELTYAGEGSAVDEYEEEKFSLTDKGLKYVEVNLAPSLTKQQAELLATFKRKMAMPLRAILRYTYETYPEYIENSMIKDKVLASG